MTGVGRKKFNRLVLRAVHDPWVTQVTGGAVPVAEFLPVDMGAPRELLTEAEVQNQLTLNELERVKADDTEERRALSAFNAFWKRQGAKKGVTPTPVRPRRGGSQRSGGNPRHQGRSA